MRIVYVEADSLRADHTQPHGYARRTTPNVEELATQSVVFERLHPRTRRARRPEWRFAGGQSGNVKGSSSGTSAKPLGSALGQAFRSSRSGRYWDSDCAANTASFEQRSPTPAAREH